MGGINHSKVDVEYGGSVISIDTNYRPGGESFLVFVHGLGCSGASFGDVWRFETFARFSVLTFDLPGFGNSSKPENFSYRLEDHAGVICALLGHFRPEKIHIVGHSMGGAIGLLVAQMMPYDLKTFVSVEGNLVGTDCDMSRRAARISYSRFRASLLESLISSARASAQPGMRLWAEWSAQALPFAFTRSAASLVEWSASGSLLAAFRGLPCRKAYIHGSKNSGMTVMRRLGDIERIAIPGSGHFPMNDNPEAFYRALAGVLERAPAG